MATLSTQLDPAAVHAKVGEIVRQLLTELGNDRAVAAAAGNAHLERELGLGSLERVELLLRLDSAFGIRLPDQAVAEADTVNDLVTAVAAAAAGAGNIPAELRAPAMPVAETPSPESWAGCGLDFAETFQEVLRHRARFDSTRPHLYLWEEDRLAATITFGQLHERSEAVAWELARRGIAPGDKVALMLPTSREFFYAFAGILLAGGIPVPIYPPFRADRIEEYAQRQSAILCNAEARLLVTFRQAERVARLLTARVASLKDVVDSSRLIEAPPPGKKVVPGAGPLLAHKPRTDDIALLQYTSGSTGEPKGVVLTHGNLLANVRAIGQALAVGPGDVGVSWLPLYHDMGLIGAWLLPLYFGFPMVILSPLAFLTRPERWLWAIHQHRGTLTPAPNFAFELCVRKIDDRVIAGLELGSLRAALNGAEPVNPETLERFARRFARYGFRREAMLPVYGLAEASLAVTIPPLGRAPRVDRLHRAIFENQGRAVPVGPGVSSDDSNVISFVSVGRPVPRHEVRIVDAHGRDLGERVEGALWFRGPSATQGYYRNAAATRQLFPANDAGSAAGRWVDSGDRAYHADGEIYVTGRVKDIIVKAGRNLYPQEVEDLAGRVAGVRKGCVVAFGVSDPTTGTERLAVTAEARERDAARRAAIAREITQEVSAALGLPPDIVELLPPHSIPKTSSGKLRREETKKRYLAGTLATRTVPAWLQAGRLTLASSAQSLRQRVRRALELAYGVYATVIFGASVVPTWLLVLLAPGRRLAARITSVSLRASLLLAGCRIRVVGRQHLKSARPVVFVSNHASYFDVLALLAALGSDYRFVAKMEVRRMPFIGTFMRKLGHHAFDRSDPQARLRQAEEIERALRRGESVWVFPEGTFTPHAGVRPFQLGAFKAAVATGSPVCPVALRGTRQILRDQTLLPRPARVTLTVCPLLLPATRPSGTADWQEIVRLRDVARTSIAQHCGEPLL